MRATFLPYSQPLLGSEETQEVADSIRRGWVSAGPKAKQFEEDFAAYVGARHALAVISGTAALHLALAALDIGPGDEVIVPTLSFCSTANVVVHLGARPVLADVDENLQISLEAAEHAVTRRTRAIIPVHYAGQPCDLKEILKFAAARDIQVVEDASHAAGAEYRGARIGGHSRAVAFSFHAASNMTTGEGGMLTTNDSRVAARMRLLSRHGLSRHSLAADSWRCEAHEPGYQYSMTDLEAALGIHQLRRLDGFIERRREIARTYNAAFADLPEIRLPEERPGSKHTYYLYPVQLDFNHCHIDRDIFLSELNRARIGASVHFLPLHRHLLYHSRFAYRESSFPVAERIYRGLVSLPLYPKMSNSDVQDVIAAVRTILLLSRSHRGSDFGRGYAAAS